MKSPAEFENLDAIENDIRRRLDENIKERRVLDSELAKFLASKQSIIDLSKKYSSEISTEPLHHEAASTRSASGEKPRELPWGKYARGVDQLVYVINEAGTRGLARLEVVDRIEAISGKRPPLNSVTTWLTRAKKRGQVRNRKRRWYAAK